MKKISFTWFVFVLVAISGCTDELDKTDVPNTLANNVLMLVVDYSTNTFEGGKEFNFSEPSEVLTITNEYEPPGDFGSIKLKYQEVNKTLFDGTMIWMGVGQMSFPMNIEPANQFNWVPTEEIVYPINGFENVFNPFNENYDYSAVWLSVQNLVKVRGYLESNPNATVKIFLYTPSVGMGDPADWNWIIYMKN